MSKLQEILNETLAEIYDDMQSQPIQENVEQPVQGQPIQENTEQSIQEFEEIDYDQQMRINSYMAGLGALELSRCIRNK